jgi:hypothetical protein
MMLSNFYQGATGSRLFYFPGGKSTETGSVVFQARSVQSGNFDMQLITCRMTHTYPLYSKSTKMPEVPTDFFVLTSNILHVRNNIPILIVLLNATFSAPSRE